MSKSSYVEATGTVIECLRGTQFSIELDNGHTVTGHLSGKMRKNYIKIIPDDRVAVEVSPYDLQKARIVYRYR